MGDFLKEVLANTDLSQIPDGGIGTYLVKAIQGFKKPKIEQPIQKPGIGNPPVAQPGQINVIESLTGGAGGQ